MRPRSSTLAAIEKAYRIVKQIDETNLEGYEITTREITVLDAVTQGASDVPSIAARLGVSSHATKLLIERMETRKIVQRVRVTGRRAFTIAATKEGTKILDHYKTLDQKTTEAVERRLGKVAVELLHKLAAVMSAQPDVLL